VGWCAEGCAACVLHRDGWPNAPGRQPAVIILSFTESLGIDLVCHSDGRLRLAVNEWPDSVRNDSSPGKLQVGKWTFFAVSYDATASGDNVSWYFSVPADTPGQPAVTLDRRTAYHAGPVDSDVGPLVIGNFNETMHGYGLDRQFRGEIRDLASLRQLGARRAAAGGSGRRSKDQ
jgi:hypothetical protein